MRLSSAAMTQATHPWHLGLGKKGHPGIFAILCASVLEYWNCTSAMEDDIKQVQREHKNGQANILIDTLWFATVTDCPKTAKDQAKHYAFLMPASIDLPW